ncbi:15965_t:CDS:2, partial [Funneliformis mosseae]
VTTSKNLTLGIDPWTSLLEYLLKTAINLWKNQDGGRLSADILLIQLGLYRNHDYLFNDPYVKGINTPTN